MYTYSELPIYLSILPGNQNTSLHSTERQHSDSSFPVTSAALSCKKKVQSQWNHQEIGWNITMILIIIVIIITIIVIMAIIRTVIIMIIIIIITVIVIKKMLVTSNNNNETTNQKWILPREQLSHKITKFGKISLRTNGTTARPRRMGMCNAHTILQ